MNNLGQMMKQAQQLQARMTQLQDEMGRLEIEGASGGGMVRITLTGKHEVRAITIDKAAVDPEEIEMLEDLIVAAFGDAKAKLDERVREETEKAMGGMKLPAGFKMPF